MAVEVIKTGVVSNGKEVEKIIITSGDMSATLLSYGAVIQSQRCCRFVCCSER